MVVLSNRTDAPVSCSLVETGKTTRTIFIASGDSRPLFYSGELQLRYQDDFKQHEYDLNAANAYFFARAMGDKALHFERIGLGEGAHSPNSDTPRSLQPGQVPTISVKILVDDDEPTHRRVWESRLRRRVGAASEVLMRHCGVRLKVVQVSTWDSDDSHNKFSLTLREFEREVPLESAQLAIGFSSQYKIAQGRIHMGGTRGTLHPYILLKERSPNIRETERLELLVHELGHFLGAAHSPEPQSVMRPVLKGGLQRAAGARIQFDPVNTLLIAMMGEELRRSRVRSLRDVSNATKRRMMQIYGVLGAALPGDPAAAQYQQLLRRRASSSASSSSLVVDTQKVLEAMVTFAKTRHPKAEDRDAETPQELDGDDLTNRYVHAAASQARKVDHKHGRKALLLALGIFMDDTEILRTFPATRGIVNAVESGPLRSERIRYRGQPTMRSRSDLAKHFFVSAHTTVVLGSKPARGVGFAKELLDAQHGTGFSFADMAANRAGVVFAEQLLKGKISLDEIAQSFSTEAYLPPIADLIEGLSADELHEKYGDEGNAALEAELTRIERRIRELPVYNH